MRGGRERLTVRNPRIEMALASLSIDEANIPDARKFGNRMQAKVNRWMAGREVITTPVRLTKAEADAKLRNLLRRQVRP